MNRLGHIISVMMVLCILLAGCGTSFDADESTVFVEKNGKIYSVDVEAVDQSYYDKNELELFIQKEVEAYNNENGKDSVKVMDISVEGVTGKLKMQYAAAEDYADFNGIEFYQGDMIKAIAAGYDFNTAFYKVEEGKVTGTAVKQDVLNGDDLKVVIIRSDVNVKVAGNIVYVSSENVTVTGPDSVSIRSEEEDDSSKTDAYTYIVYQ